MSSATVDAATLHPSCDGRFGLCGYRDQSRTLVIPHRFERALKFNEGLAAVRVEGRWGYVDSTGRIAIEPQFALAGDFHHGLAEVVVGRKAGAIDRSGRVVVPARFHWVKPVTSDVVLASEIRPPPKLPSIDPEEWPHWNFESDLAHQARSGPLGLYSVSHGRWIRWPDLHEVTPHGQEGMFWAKTNNDWTVPTAQRRLLGLLRPDGTWQLRPRFEFVSPWSDGSATVRVADEDGRNQRIGLIDANGNEIVPFAMFKQIRVLEAGLYAIAREGKWGLAAAGGRIILEPSLDSIHAQDGDVFEAVSSGRRVGLTREGTLVAHPDEGKVVKACPNGLKLVSREGSHQLVGPDERPLTPILDRGMQLECDKPSWFRMSGKYGFVRPDGWLHEARFTNSWGFFDGVAIVQESEKWGLVDDAGKIILHPRYDSLMPLMRWNAARLRQERTRLFRARIDGRDLIIDRQGVEQPPPSSRQPFRDRIDCGHGIALKDRDGLWGIVDEAEMFIVPPVYRALGCYHQGIAWGADDMRRKWMPIGIDGKVRDGLPPPRTTWFPTWVSHHSYEKLHEDRYESSVLWTRCYYEYLGGRCESPPRIVGDGTQAHGTRPIFE